MKLIINADQRQAIGLYFGEANLTSEQMPDDKLRITVKEAALPFILNYAKRTGGNAAFAKRLYQAAAAADDITFSDVAKAVYPATIITAEPAGPQGPVCIDMQQKTAVPADEMPNMPKDTVWIQNDFKFKNYLVDYVKMHGRINTLFLAGHGGDPDRPSLHISPQESVTAPILQKVLTKAAEKGAANLNQPEKRVYDMLVFLKSQMADGSSIWLVECNVAGKGIETLHSELQNFFGPRITVYAFPGKCGFRNGWPTGAGNAFTQVRPLGGKPVKVDQPLIFKTPNPSLWDRITDAIANWGANGNPLVWLLC
jgi:hypothetical protein